MKTSSSLRRGEAGSVATVFALLLLPLLLVAGLAVDIQRMQSVRQALQAAADSAALAIGSDPAITPAAAESMLAAYLAANASAGQYTVTASSLVFDEKAKTVSIDVQAQTPATFMSIAGYEVLDVGADAKIERSTPGPLDVTLVLDTTTSMAAPPSGGTQPKITSMIAAASALVTQIMADGNPEIRVGVVPFSGHVNVGFSNSPPAWIMPRSRSSTVCLQWSVANPSAPCTLRTADCMVDGVLRTNGCSWWDCSAQGTRTCLRTELRTTNWNGCIGPRTIAANGTGTDGFLPRIDDPTRPAYPGVPADFGQCATAQILPLTTSRTDVLSRINALRANGGDTYIPGGLTWGWNVLAPGEPYEARTMEEMREKGGRKALVLMTDGINWLSPRLSDAALLPNGHVTLTADWRSGAKTNALTSTLCENIKASGIEVYTVLFGVNDAAIEQILRNCATEPGMAFRAEDQAGLLKAFSRIGDRLRKLRLLN